MEWSLTQSKLLVFHRLVRTGEPVGVLLLLWPTLWALWVTTPDIPRPWVLTVFVADVWLVRAAGCVVDDYVGRKFDGHVRHMANRPLPNGAIMKKGARALFVALVLILFLLALTLNTTITLLSIAALALTWAYPFMKRCTHLPQVVLDMAFGWSTPMTFAAVSEPMPLSRWLMFLANIFWAVAYDTQHAVVDRDDDVKIDVKSTVTLFDWCDKLIIGILQIGILALVAVIGELDGLDWGYYRLILAAGALFIYQWKLIANRERGVCFKVLMNNNYVGLVLFLGLTMSYWHFWWCKKTGWSSGFLLGYLIRYASRVCTTHRNLLNLQIMVGRIRRLCCIRQFSLIILRPASYSQSSNTCLT